MSLLFRANPFIICTIAFLTTLSAAADAPGFAPRVGQSIKLTATDSEIGPVSGIISGLSSGEPIASPPGTFHAISFKGMGDVIGAVVLDGTIHPVLPGFIRESLAISPDGQHLAYIRRTDSGKRSVVVDGVEGKIYDGITVHQPIFSPDGRQLAYTASTQVAPGIEAQFLVLNNVEGTHYKFIWPFVQFSPNSRHVLFVASNDAAPGRGGQLFLVIDGVEGKSYSGNGYVTPQQNFTFSPDSQHFAFSVWDGKQGWVVRDGVEQKRYDGIPMHSLHFSPDSQHLAYLAESSHKFIVVRDGMESAPFDNPDPPGQPPIISFSPDSQHLAYRTKQNGKLCIALDGVVGKAYDYVTMPCFSPDSRHFGYSAKMADESCVVIDGREGQKFYSTGTPAFSPDGLHVAYWARAKIDYARYFVVFDGAPGKEYGSPAGGPIFSPDSRHLAYAAQRGDPFCLIVVDGVECPLPSPIVFDPKSEMFFPDTFYFKTSDELCFFGVKMPNSQFVRVTVKIQPLAIH